MLETVKIIKVMKRSSRALARHIIYLLNQKGEEYTPNNTKVQKILYSYVGFALANKLDKDIIIDELPCAWEHGPVFPNVFKMIKEAEDISDLEAPIINLSREEEQILNLTVEKLGHFPAGKLSTWTHLEGSPWDIVWNIQENEYGKIPLELIKEYFDTEIENIL